MKNVIFPPYVAPISELLQGTSEKPKGKDRLMHKIIMNQ